MTQQDCNVTYYKVLSKDGCACHGGGGKYTEWLWEMVGCQIT